MPWHSPPLFAVCVCAVQLLHKMSIRAVDGTDTLLKIIRNPITVHLPVGARVIGGFLFSWCTGPSARPRQAGAFQQYVYIIVNAMR